MHIAHDMVESHVLPWLGSGCLYSSYQTDLFNSHSLEAESYNSDPDGSFSRLRF